MALYVLLRFITITGSQTLLFNVIVSISPEGFNHEFSNPLKRTTLPLLRIQFDVISSKLCYFCL